jgi:cyclophilin family peptidyl-prolyl cis-trans isomerase
MIKGALESHRHLRYGMPPQNRENLSMHFKQFGTAILIGIGLLMTNHTAEADNSVVTLKTSMGDITLELYSDKAPVTVENFLKYVDDGFYKGTIFHRVIRNFMIQGGGFTSKMAKKSTRDAIKNEAANGLKNSRGTIAMARTMVPDSATAQFFLNTVDNPKLDFKNPSPRGIGYCVFGRVTKGLDIVDKIEAVATGVRGGMRDVPQTEITIEDVIRVKAAAEVVPVAIPVAKPEAAAQILPVERMVPDVVTP